MQNSIAEVVKLLNREVWIVTARAGERRGGLLATWVTQASLDPSLPAVMIGLSSNHFTAELIDQSNGFALHLLNQSQTSLALDFAIGSGRHRDKLAGLETFSDKTGAPILRNCLAWLDCRVTERLDRGDRICYWAKVESGGRSVAARDSGMQVLKEQELIAAANEEQKQALQTNLLTDIQYQRTMLERKNQKPSTK